MSEFIGYSVGLVANGHGQNNILVKAEFSRLPGGDVELTAVSGRNQSRLKGTATLSAEVWDSRPNDPYDTTILAVWALRHLGYSIAALNDEDENEEGL